MTAARILLALAVMIPARWLIAAISPVRGGEGRLLDPAAALRRPMAGRRARACLALYRLRCRVQAWADPA